MSFRRQQQGRPGDHPALGGINIEPVPHPKEPKARPPRGMRDNTFFPGRRLPTYTGPYAVGTMEIEVPAREPRHFSRIKRKHRHVLQLETVLMTIYYPATGSVQGVGKKGHGPSRELWLGRPRLEIARGYGRFASIGDLAVPMFFPTLFTQLPAYRNAGLAKHWAADTDFDRSRTELSDKPEEAEPPPGLPKQPRFPVIMFSHGLGGTRTMYSSVCGEFASYGFVVVAVEHRDGSGPRTYINHAPDGAGSLAELEKNQNIDHTHKERQRGYDTIDYVFPEGNRFDTSPNSQKGVDHELRGAQVDLRLAEIEEAYYVLELLDQGRGQEVSDMNLRRKGFKSSSSHGLQGIDWSDWKDRLHLQYVTACGHSFGGATVTEILRHDDRFNWVSQGIIYDIWGAGTRPPEEDAPQHRIHKPICAIMSEAFTYWPSNDKLVTSIVEEAESGPNPAPAWLLTLRGTVHVSQSDFSLLYPNMCSLLLKQLANPRRALDLNINASLEFVSKMLPQPIAQVIRAWQNEEILEHNAEPLSRIPSAVKHRPKERYTAMRLKVKHEWLYRASPSLARKVRQREIQRTGIAYTVDKEVWLRHKPHLFYVLDYQDMVKEEWENRHGGTPHPSEAAAPTDTAEDSRGQVERHFTSTGQEVETKDPP